MLKSSSSSSSGIYNLDLAEIRKEALKVAYRVALAYIAQALLLI